MSITDQEARAMLSARSLRVTAPRLAVMQLLAESERPLSHTEVVEALAAQRWDQATLYRNLVKLSEAGLTRVTSELAGVKRYELTGARSEAKHAHPHFVCNECGVVSCLPESTISPSIKDVSALDASWSGALSSASIHLVGVCPPCQEAS